MLALEGCVRLAVLWKELLRQFWECSWTCFMACQCLNRCHHWLPVKESWLRCRWDFQRSLAVTVCPKDTGLQGCSAAEELQAQCSAGTAGSEVQSLEGELCPSQQG